jgi:protein-disulfide isomerase
MISKICCSLLLVIGLVMLTWTASATEPVTPDQKKAFEQIIHDYLVNNPDVLVGILKDAQAREQAQAAELAQQMVVQKRDALTNDPQSPVGGNPKGDVTLVEFFDYRCPYCKQVEPSLEAMLHEDPNLRIVYKEFPILGPPSVVASRVALAARRQGKYDEFHRAMMNTKGQITDDVIAGVARSVGLDLDKIKTDMAAPDVESVIKDDYALAQALNIRATPVFIVDDAILPGVIEIDTLRQLIANSRNHE